MVLRFGAVAIPIVQFCGSKPSHLNPQFFVSEVTGSWPSRLGNASEGPTSYS